MVKSLTLALKDIKLLLRDKTAMFWVLVFPLLMAMVFGSVFGGSNGPNKIDVALIDQDHSKQSSKLMSELKESKALNVTNPDAANGVSPLRAAQEAVRKGDLAAYILIPRGFGDEVSGFRYAEGPALRIGIDPSRQAEAGMLTGVTSQAAYGLMSDMMGGAASSANSASLALTESSPPQDIATSNLQPSKPGAGPSAGFQFQGPRIESDAMSDVSSKPASSFEITFPQALVWGLLGVISSFAVSLVKEREQGTLVRLQTSMSMSQILAGKALACLFTCLGVMATLVAIGHLVFHIRLQSPGLFGMAILSGSICVVGIMMLLSVLGRTEQAVSGSSWGIMILMSMFGGGMIPVFMMPGWMQTASNFSPLKWTVLSVEGAIWRDFTFKEMLTPCAILVSIGALSFLIGARVLKARV